MPIVRDSLVKGIHREDAKTRRDQAVDVDLALIGEDVRHRRVDIGLRWE